MTEAAVRFVPRSWPIIVGGCHRSGTSLVRRILDAHTRIYCGPEVKFFRDFYGDYLHDPIRHGRFFASARAILPEADLLDSMGHAFVGLQQQAAERAGKVRWADKNPENVLYLNQWQRLLGDEWLMVQVVRHPLDTLASIKEAGFPLVIPSEMAARAEFYCRYTAAGLAFGAAHPARYHQVIYEQLVTDPAGVVRELMAWLGEESEPEQLSFNARPHQTGLEDPKVGHTAQVHTHSVGRWRTILTPDEAALVRDLCLSVWRRVDPDLRYGHWTNDADEPVGEPRATW